MAPLGYILNSVPVNHDKANAPCDVKQDRHEDKFPVL